MLIIYNYVYDINIKKYQNKITEKMSHYILRIKTL
jgi:hypothetical protein